MVYVTGRPRTAGTGTAVSSWYTWLGHGRATNARHARQKTDCTNGADGRLTNAPLNGEAGDRLGHLRVGVELHEELAERTKVGPVRQQAEALGRIRRRHGHDQVGSIALRCAHHHLVSTALVDGQAEPVRRRLQSRATQGKPCWVRLPGGRPRGGARGARARVARTPSPLVRTNEW